MAEFVRLAVAPATLIPLLAIGVFSGIRSAEIARLEWQDVLWDRGYIEVKARKAKTKSRRLVPLKDNLKRWLEPFRKKSGQISEVECSSTGLNSLGDAVGFKWRQNALRHSYASYRLAEIQSAAQVALELGNSPEKLFAHYRELVTPEAASDSVPDFSARGMGAEERSPASVQAPAVVKPSPLASTPNLPVIACLTASASKRWSRGLGAMKGITRSPTQLSMVRGLTPGARRFLFS